MDIRMLREMPAERWFWFDPPFNPNHSALLHMQADNVWRVGNQLGKVKQASNAKARDVLGWQPRSNDEAIVATAESLVAFGLLDT